MVSIYFQYPSFLFLLLLIPLFILIYFFSVSFYKKKAMIFGNFEAMQRAFGVDLFSKNLTILFISILIILFLILSISGMHCIYNVNTDAFSYVVLVDSSKSMGANDVYPSRLEFAKNFVKDLVDNMLAGVSFGIISFAGNAEIISELDNSKLRLKASLDNLDFSSVDGTNLPNALLIANNMLSNEKYKAVILISDGQINVGEIPQMTDYALANNIIIHTFAVGTQSGGVTSQDVVSKTNLDSLKALAFNSNGRFFDFETLSDLSTTLQDFVTKTNREVDVRLDLYLISFSLLFFFIVMILINFRFRTIP